MQPRQRHGRKGSSTEYYEFDFQCPKFITQRVGDDWIVGYAHAGVIRFHTRLYARMEIGKTIAQDLAQQFLTRFCEHRPDKCGDIFPLLDTLLQELS
jgi:hypothetical protein